MYHNEGSRQAVADLNAGIKISRATAAIENGADALFNVKGGRILLLGLVGQITDVMDATATTLKITANPDTGSDTDLCIASASIATEEVGTMFTLPAAVGSALTISSTMGAAPLTAPPVFVVAPGTLDLVAGVGANAGKAKWDLFYVPLDKGAYVEAA